MTNGSWRLFRLPRPNTTIRLRLTLLYGSLFLAAGLLVLLVSYTLVRQSLNDRLQPIPTFIMAPGPDTEIVGPDGEAMELRETEPLTEDGRTLRQAVEEFEADLREEALNQLLLQSGIALALTTVIAAGAGWFVAGRALRPVTEITNAARRASDTDLHARVNLSGPRDELKELADTFDHMLARLEIAFESQRRFAAEASHELRTPISIIQAEADIILATPDVTEREQRLASAVSDAAMRGERLISSLLTLARSQSTMIDHAPVDLATIVGDVVGDLSRRADRLNIAIDLELADAWVFGDRLLLERLVTNLVENAIVHNHMDGWVRVEVGQIGNRVHIRVANSGQVIPHQHVRTLFEPFRSYGNPALNHHGGTGLGLAIAHAVVSSHAGTITAAPRVDGGLEVNVSLPRFSDFPHPLGSSHGSNPSPASAP